MNGLDLSRYTAILVQAFALEAELQAKYKLLRSDPSNDPAEYAALLAEIEAEAAKLAALWTEANALLKDTGITAAQIAEAHAHVEAGHARNQKVSEDPAPPPAASIYNKNVPYEDKSEIPSDDALKAQGFVTGDIVAISTIGHAFWQVRKSLRSGFKELRKIG